MKFKWYVIGSITRSNMNDIFDYDLKLSEARGTGLNGPYECSPRGIKTTLEVVSYEDAINAQVINEAGNLLHYHYPGTSISQKFLFGFNDKTVADEFALNMANDYIGTI